MTGEPRKQKGLFIYDHNAASLVLSAVGYNDGYYERLVDMYDKRSRNTEKRQEKGITALEAYSPKQAVGIVFTHLFEMEKKCNAVRTAQDPEGRVLMKNGRPVRLLEVYQDIILKEENLCLVVSSYPKWGEHTDPNLGTIFENRVRAKERQLALAI
jgi:hypothetical protein